MPGKAIIYHEPISPDLGYGEIKAVAPSRIEQFSSYSSFEVDMDKVMSILDGTRSASHYCVILAGDEPAVVVKEEFDYRKIAAVPHIVRVPRVLGVVPEIRITIDYVNRVYRVEMVGSAQIKMGATAIYRGQKFEALKVFVVDDRHPAMIIDQFVVDGPQLANDGAAQVPFMHDRDDRLAVMVSNFFHHIVLEERR